MLALINAGLAQGKNRSGYGWFWLSLLLGPLATLILVGFCDKLPGPWRNHQEAPAKTDSR
jgi:hypothetical protein